MNKGLELFTDTTAAVGTTQYFIDAMAAGFYGVDERTGYAFRVVK